MSNLLLNVSEYNMKNIFNGIKILAKIRLKLLQALLVYYD